MSSLDRLELEQEVAQANDEEIKLTLTDLEDTLESCCESLSQVEEKERFLGIRIARYKSLMEERELKMQSMVEEPTDSHSSEDVENADSRLDLDALRARHAKDSRCLSEVEKLHKGILAELEKLRRRVEHLEEQRDDVQAKRNECRDCMLALGSYELT
ncbi:hypothetical protein THAOC_35083 [Thalassiosira oceanica]|uniref:Uncharacterized protein n=1 Tax=Thalassiosira oceanica TaxID=159749 RepID=K0R2F8_THAOC|nr:hypothetical protein THAOC_35083 [Thalassiosira oceanica]|eukprot:EJK46255.1 hypothetical protein THAOC_35083 [Thalassiosira oceanica]